MVEPTKSKAAILIEEMAHSCFRPKGASDLRQTYPELSKIKELRDIGTKDLLFAYYYKCKASDAQRLERDQDRIEYAVKMVYGDDPPHKIIEKYSAGNMPDKLKEACSIMERFEPGMRALAKRIMQNAMENFYKASQIDINSDSNFVDGDGVIDWSKKKAAIEMLATISKNTPDVLARLENNAFGVSDEIAIDAMSITGNPIAAFHDKRLD